MGPEVSRCWGYNTGLPEPSLSRLCPLQMGPLLPWVNWDFLPSLLFPITDPATQTHLLSCPGSACPAASPTRTVPSPIGAWVTVTCPRNHSLRDPLGHSALCLLLQLLSLWHSPLCPAGIPWSLSRETSHVSPPRWLCSGFVCGRSPALTALVSRSATALGGMQILKPRREKM